MFFFLSHCLTHPWKFNTAIRNKRSVFYYAPSQSSSRRSRSPKTKRHRRAKTGHSSRSKKHYVKKRVHSSSVAKKKSLSSKKNVSRKTDICGVPYSSSSNQAGLVDDELSELEPQIEIENQFSDLRIE